MLRHAGYKQVEGYQGLFPSQEAAQQLRDMLDTNELSMPTCHFDLETLINEPGDVIAHAKTLGVRAVIAPYLNKESRPVDRASWEAFGLQLHQASKPFLDAELKFGWHNHGFEFAWSAPSERAIDVILATAPKIQLELDIGWATLAGVDLIEFIKCHAGRLIAAHIKDTSMLGCGEFEDDADCWVNVGSGIIQWEPVLQELVRAHTAYFVLEHDNPENDCIFCRKSLEHVSSIFKLI